MNVAMSVNTCEQESRRQMLTVKEKIKVAGYFKQFYRCPHCGMEFPLVNSVYYCVECRRSIIDVGLVLHNTQFALRYHFGFIEEVKDRYIG